MSEKIIELKGVNKWFGDFQVLKDVNLEVGLKQKIVVFIVVLMLFCHLATRPVSGGGGTGASGYSLCTSGPENGNMKNETMNMET